METWKDIYGYESIYKISNFGTIIRTSNNKCIKSFITEKGYVKIRLHKNGKCSKFLVHRLLMIAFVDKPINKHDVNHMNGIKTDNRLDNLEWCTRQENIIHSFKNGLSIRSKNAGKKQIRVIDLSNSFVYNSISELADKLNMSKSTLTRKIKNQKINYSFL